MATVHIIRSGRSQARPVVALFAAEAKKEEMLRLIRAHVASMQRLTLIAPRPIARAIRDDLALPIAQAEDEPNRLRLEVMSGRIDAVVYLRDALTPFPPDRRLGPLLDACDLFQVPVATNAATAALVLRHVAATPASGTARSTRHPSAFPARRFPWSLRVVEAPRAGNDSN